MYKANRVILLSFCILIMLGLKFNYSQAQITIPAKVTTFLSEKYPAAENIVWQKSLFKYVASFKNTEGKEYFISFNSNGNWNYTTSRLTYDSLPSEVIKTYENSLYDSSKGWSISDVDQYESPEVPFAYRIHIYKGSFSKKIVYVSEAGKMIKVTGGL